MAERICRKCGIELTEKNQTAHGKIVKFKRRHCKACYYEKNKQYFKDTNRSSEKRWEKTVSGFLRRKVRAWHVKNKCNSPTCQEIYGKFKDDKNFLRMFSEWSLSGYKRELLPYLVIKKRGEKFSLDNLVFKLRKARKLK